MFLLLIQVHGKFHKKYAFFMFFGQHILVTGILLFFNRHNFPEVKFHIID